MRADLALIGFGNVGRRFARLLAQRRDWLALDYDLECRIVGIATRRHGWTFDAEGMDAVQVATELESAPDSCLGRTAAEGTTSDGSLDVIRALGRSTADLKVADRNHHARRRRRTTRDRLRARGASGRLRRGDGEQGTGVVRLRGARCAGHGSRPVVPVRRRGHGRRAGVQSGAADVAGRADPRVSRRHQQHHEPRPDRDRAWRGFRQRGRAHAGAGHCGGRPVARSRRVGCRRQDRGACERADARANDAAGGRARGHRTRDGATRHGREGARAPCPSCRVGSADDRRRGHVGAPRSSSTRAICSPA